MKTLPLLLILSAALTPFCGLRGQVRVDALVWQANDELVITFSDDGSGTAGDFAVQKSADLSAGSWTAFGSAAIEAQPGGSWRAVIHAPEDEPRAFFRIVKGGVAVTAAFQSETATLREGAGSGVRVQFSAPFSGTLRYTLDSGSGPIASQVEGDGSSSVLIPVTALADDKVANQLTFLTLRLLEDPSYSVSGFGVTVIVEDNDALWGGILDSDQDDVDVALRLLTAQQNGVSSACLKTDGAGLLPPNSGGDGDWLFSSFTLTDTEFSGTAGPVTIPAADTLYGHPTELVLTFDTSAGGSVSEGRLEGRFTLSTAVPALPHLSFPARTGSFVFVRQAATPVNLEAPAP